MKITIDGLLVLDAINTHGSFASAAKSLHRVPSAISYSMKKLEQELGAELFNRTGHRAVLTEAGLLLLQEGRQLINAIEDLECQIKKVSDGWESQLIIAVGDMFPVDGLLALINSFYGEGSGTRIKVLTEVYGGLWDALVSKRADLVIGAPSDGPAGGGYHTRPMSEVDWVFAVSPMHPLAAETVPLTEEKITKYRAIVVADTSRKLLPRSGGIFTGQDILTVSSFEMKIKAHIQGMGVGFLPRQIIERSLQRGLLIEKELEIPPQSSSTYIAWRTGATGRSLQWFLDNINGAAFNGERF